MIGEKERIPAVVEETPASMPPPSMPAPVLPAGKRRRAAMWIALAAVAALIVGVLLGRQSTRWLPGAWTETEAPEPFEATFSELYPDLIHLNDPNFGDIWIPAYRSLSKNALDPADFTVVNGVPTYEKDGVRSVLGVDVSEHQGTVDWARVKAAGVDFAMIRIGYRGYVYGQLHEDVHFRENLKNARAAGVKVGAYFFSQATTPEEAAEEARFAADLLKGTTLDLPVAFDWETIAYDEARTDEMEAERLTAVCRAFCDAIRAAGYEPMLYMYKALAYQRYTLGDFSDVPFWIADITDTPSFYYRFSMWQYTYEGQIDGIDGDADLNLAFVNADGHLFTP